MSQVSVIVPVYNGEQYLVAALDSILTQTRVPTEIIVVDDGSTDGSAAIAQSCAPQVRYSQLTHLGPAAARNAGIERARGDLLAFLDADDLWMPDKLDQQVRVPDREPDCEAVLGRVEGFVSPEVDERQHQVLAESASQSGHSHVGALLSAHTLESTTVIRFQERSSDLHRTRVRDADYLSHRVPILHSHVKNHPEVQRLKRRINGEPILSFPKPLPPKC